MKKILLLIVFGVMLQGCAWLDRSDPFQNNPETGISLSNEQEEEKDRNDAAKQFQNKTGNLLKESEKKGETQEIFIALLKEHPTDCAATELVPRLIPSNSSAPNEALMELFTGPTEKERSRGLLDFWITRERANLLKEIKVINQTAYLNWHDIRSIIPGASTSCGGTSFLSAIQNTLTRIPNIKNIIHAINGSPEVFYEWVQIGCDETNNLCDATAFHRKEEISIPQMLMSDLKIPWEIAFLPGEELLITQRPGSLLLASQSCKKKSATLGVCAEIPISETHHLGEGGLMGMVPHPNYEQNAWIYLYVSTNSGAGISNQVLRFEYRNNRLQNRRIIMDDIPGAVYHDGGRMEFGPDNKLYITTGDAGSPHLAQDLNSLAGKILRVNDDASVPEDNPFGNSVYSYGHRNSQGITWDDKGNLWATEHGRSGILSGFDELNRIQKGANYGWPEIQGDEQKEDMISPVLHSGPNETWAPGDIEYLNRALYFVGLRGEALYKVAFQSEGDPILSKHFVNAFGRLRALKKGPDGFLYITTSNTDGRGEPRVGDDKLIKISPP